MNDSHVFSRRIVQIFTILAMILIPTLHIFRLDVPSRSFVLFGDKLWFQEVYLIIVTMLLLIFLMIGMIKILGRIPCGWMCFRNTLCELSDLLVNDKEGLRKILSYGALILLAFFFGIVTTAYFFDWLVIVDDIFHLRFTLPSAMAVFLTVLIYVDMRYFRHSFCDSACPYGLMQNVFSDEKTMRVTFDKTHCIDCSLCEKSCFLDIDPRISAQDTCVSCGDCIAVCKKIFKDKDVRPSLVYSFGADPNASFRLGQLLKDKRFLVVVVYNLVMFTVWTMGVASHQPMDVAVYQVKSGQSWIVEKDTATSYFQVIVNNSTPTERTLSVEIDGIGKEYAVFSENSVVVPSGKDHHIDLAIHAPKGVFEERQSQSFQVLLRSDQGEEPVAVAEGSFYMPEIP